MGNVCKHDRQRGDRKTWLRRPVAPGTGRQNKSTGTKQFLISFYTRVIFYLYNFYTWVFNYGKTKGFYTSDRN